MLVYSVNDKLASEIVVTQCCGRFASMGWDFEH